MALIRMPDVSQMYLLVMNRVRRSQINVAGSAPTNLDRWRAIVLGRLGDILLRGSQLSQVYGFQERNLVVRSRDCSF